MKTLDQCLQESEEKYSRKVNEQNVDCLYPILNYIIKVGVKEWLRERKQELENRTLNDYTRDLLKWEYDERIAELEKELKEA